MPEKQSSQKRPRSQSRRGSPLRRAEPVGSKLKQAQENAKTLRTQAAQIARKSAKANQKADKVHEGAEQLHKGVDDLHQKTRRDGPSKAARVNRTRLVVGIGASAGGIEPLLQLLRRLPPNTGMAFVTVFHLDPTHESKLSEVLQAVTKMPVKQITNRMDVEANTVYVIPPNRDVEIEKGTLVLSPRKRNKLNLPIDRFFESLAQSQGNLAVGVILSGGGHDGSLGLSQIKAEGGITFAQDEASSAFYPMPQSAVATGCVDYVLRPEPLRKNWRTLLNNSGPEEVTAQSNLNLRAAKKS